jgi:hypothetical protein
MKYFIDDYLGVFDTRLLRFGEMEESVRDTRSKESRGT